MDTPYVYTMPGRRPTMLIALLASGAFVALGWSYGAAWYALAPAALGLAMAMFTLIRNPVYELRIDRQAVEIDRNGNIKRIGINTINYVRITEWTDGSDATIHLKDGTLHPIPEMTSPPVATLRAVLAQHGIVVKSA